MRAATIGWLVGILTATGVGAAAFFIAPDSGPWRVAGVALNTVAFGGMLGVLVGIAASRFASHAAGSDTAERLLSLATAGLPNDRVEWGAAMRAELSAIDDPEQRRRFARSAAGAAVFSGFGHWVPLGLATGLAVATATLIASRAQLSTEGPGILSVTVPFPALVLLVVSLATAARTRRFRAGIHAGITAFAASLVAVAVIAATEGMVWMDRLGVFALDADPPRGAVTVTDVALDLFTTGMWLAHVLFWLPWPFVGAWIGSRGGASHVKTDARGVRTVR